MSDYFKCLSCLRVYEDVGDDHWIECPYCGSSEARKAIENKDYELEKP